MDFCCSCRKVVDFFRFSDSFCKKKGFFLWEKEEVSWVVCVFLRFKVSLNIYSLKFLLFVCLIDLWS